MTYDDPKDEVVRIGLAQIPREGLLRLKARMDAGLPIHYGGEFTWDGYG